MRVPSVLEFIFRVHRSAFQTKRAKCLEQNMWEPFTTFHQISFRISIQLYQLISNGVQVYTSRNDYDNIDKTLKNVLS